ncbi:TetR/AcrR family transcriptional regulator [Minwuia thermotolerans]|nr:TetR/AcrR family transcriptional regulator [Minwuia thermotolerans]
MGKRAQHEMALLTEAAKLFRRQGYAATGTNEILAAAGAPRGSLYYYFPGGKEEIGTRAIEAAAKRVTLTLRALAEESADPADFVDRYVAKLTGWMAKSGWRDGCPITTVLLENAPGSAAITAVGREAHERWRREVETMLLRHGWPGDRAPATARTILMTIGGAQIHARVAASPAPLEDCAAELRHLLADSDPSEF